MVDDSELRAALIKEGSVKLHCQEGRSDKVYDIHLVPAGEGVTVQVSYGPRGGTRKVESKTPGGPVDKESAIKIASSLLKAKIRGGYRPVEGAAGTVSSITQAIEAVDTGLRPQLLTDVGDNPFEIYDLLRSAPYAAQEKMDGERRMLMVDASSNVVGANRRGMAVPLPVGLSRELLALGRMLTLDGEAMGDEFWAFDLLSIDGQDVRALSFERRYALLSTLPFEGRFIKRCPTAWSFEEKSALIERVADRGGEGVVFKDRHAGYTSGRNADQLKFKFWNTLSAVVAGTNAGKRSVSLTLFDEKGVSVPVGNVTVPANVPIPRDGSIVEVRYLYGYKGGSLFQPTLLRCRTDLSSAECTLAQVRYKVDPATTQASAA